ncbi:MAG: DeoR/GlpR transcriptional regulator [Lentisphaeria bacterium]|nr:DeoR/GlpR transcriptional regulator [Lentisphaeria bacterium]MBQ7396828.1 DeoR/GlpR transcriptional regulator [Lentisphaeria bacterium]MBR7119514.1 DeoR/GlpR transcriptional regulator [Lentisphaeria bacterium]
MRKDSSQRIISVLAEKEFLSTAEASELLGSSEVTCRRIFNRLAERNLVRRVRGGIRRFSNSSEMRIPFGLRDKWFSAEKELIAREAAKFITPGVSVAIHGGTTTSLIGMFVEAGTLLVDSLSICRILAERFPNEGGPRVVLTGGEFDYRADMLSGPEAENGFARYFTDYAIISCRALDEHGIMDDDSHSVSMISRCISNAEKSILLADHSKFNQRSFVRGPGWENIDILITDFYPENFEIIKKIKESGVEIIQLSL